MPSQAKFSLLVNVEFSLQAIYDIGDSYFEKELQINSIIPYDRYIAWKQRSPKMKKNRPNRRYCLNIYMQFIYISVYIIYIFFLNMLQIRPIRYGDMLNLYHSKQFSIIINEPPILSRDNKRKHHFLFSCTFCPFFR